MKKLMLLLLGFMAWNVTQAQCEPNENVPDSVFVEPLPFNADERPDGGIALPACVGELYEFTFTFNIPEEYDSDFGTIPLTFCRYSCGRWNRGASSFNGLCM
jgi:hypothetical protein